MNQNTLLLLSKSFGHSLLYCHLGVRADTVCWKGHILTIEVPLTSLQCCSQNSCKTHMILSSLWAAFLAHLPTYQSENMKLIYLCPILPENKSWSCPFSWGNWLVSHGGFIDFLNLQVSRSACLMTTQLICKLLRSREAAAAVDIRTWPPVLDTGECWGQGTSVSLVTVSVSDIHMFSVSVSTRRFAKEAACTDLQTF